MKRLVRSSAVQSSLAWLFSSYLKFVYATLRWTREGHERAQGVWADKETGVILLLWHARIPLSTCTWELRNGAQDMRALISRSADGEFIARTMERLDIPSIRGSRRKARAPHKDKGGGEALREMVRWVKDGGAVALTPDGPHGPNEVMGEGSAMVARLTGAPVLLVGIACNPCLRAPSWDRTVLPLPFARAAMVWDGPDIIGKDYDPAALTADWQARLRAVTARAEALVR